MPFWRRKSALPPIDEAEAYDRSYGQPRTDVKLIRLPPRRPRDREVLAHGELLRRAFLDRLEHREAEPEDTEQEPQPEPEPEPEPEQEQEP